jgi:hypothetical protein
MKSNAAWACAILVTGLGASAARAQSTQIYNPSFEEVNPDDPSLPRGWAKFNTARYRRVGDGLTPALLPVGTPGALTPHTGEATIELPSGADFSGFTTNAFNPDTLQYYDPGYVWQGGPITISGWYMIPANEPLVGANSGLKLEFRRTANNSIYQSFEHLDISGTTNGEWRQFSFTVQNSDFGVYPLPPENPNARVSVLPLRFGAATSTGTIFWDDIQLSQQTCRADVTGDGQVNVQDFLAFLQLFAAADPRADFDNSGSVNVQDFLAFLQAFAAGCT